MDEDGLLLNGEYRVTVDSDVEGEEGFILDKVEFTGGKATVEVTLNNVGRHNLRVYVDSISYSNLVTVEVVAQTFASGKKTAVPDRKRGTVEHG